MSTGHAVAPDNLGGLRSEGIAGREDSSSEPTSLPLPTVVSLLCEYTTKLNEIVKEAGRLLTASLRTSVVPVVTTRLEYEASVRLIQTILPPARALAHLVSQVLQHAPPAELVTVELRLRLAEFESALFACQQAQTTLQQNPPPRKGS